MTSDCGWVFEYLNILQSLKDTRIYLRRFQTFKESWQKSSEIIQNILIFRLTALARSLNDRWSTIRGAISFTVAAMVVGSNCWIGMDRMRLNPLPLSLPPPTFRSDPRLLKEISYSTPSTAFSLFLSAMSHSAFRFRRLSPSRNGPLSSVDKEDGLSTNDGCKAINYL